MATPRAKHTGSTRSSRRNGAAERARYRDFAHTGPGTLAGRFMRRFWQPVYIAGELPPGHARPVRLMGEDFTLYRGESGTPHLVGFRCRHRGAMLSVGWVEGDDIRCFYHGWKYGPDGGCVQQPAEPRPFCKDVPVASWPVEEYLGIIFAYVGEGAPPPLQRYANFERAGGVLLLKRNIRGFNFFQDFENNMDRVHGGFVHREQANSFDGAVDSPLVTAEEDGWGLKTHARHPGGRYGVQTFGMPATMRIMVTFEACERMIWIVPVDDESCVHYNLSIYADEAAIAAYREGHREHPAIGPEEPFRLAAEVVAGHRERDSVNLPPPELTWFEDDVVLLSQGRIANRDADCLGASDAPVVLLRNLWEREMRALDQGLPMKEWRYSAEEQIRRV